MRVALVAPFNEKCGIADYSILLFEALQKLCSIDIIEIPSNKTRKAFRDIADQLNYNSYDIVHIQHSPGLFGGDRVGIDNLGYVIRPLRFKYVITMHEIGRYKREYERANKFSSIIRNIKSINYNIWYSKVLNHCLSNVIRKASRLVVHSKCEEEVLKKIGIKANIISVIPHGVRIINNSIVNNNNKNSLKKDGIILCTFGFIKRFKNYESVINVLPELDKNIIYIIAGSPQDKSDEKYYSELNWLVEKLSLKNRVIFTGYLSDSDIDIIVNSADIMIYPYKYSASSGAMARALGLGKAILASDLVINEEINMRQCGTIELYSSNKEMKLKITDMLNYELKRKQLENNAYKYAVKYSYDNVAIETISMYKNVLNQS